MVNAMLLYSPWKTGGHLGWLQTYLKLTNVLQNAKSIKCTRQIFKICPTDIDKPRKSAIFSDANKL